MIRYTSETLVKNTARDVGFSLVGITSVKPSRESDAVFDRWIEEGRHGEMRYLSGGSDKRHAPGLLLEGARSVISVAVNYYSEARARRNREDAAGGRGVFSTYSHGRDYHNVLGEMLDELERRLQEIFPHMRSVACVDTQPISERDFAIRSGIAWLGKNTCVISNEYGSWIFLGELVTNLDLESDRPLTSLCGTCRRCLDACPTGALEEAFVLDATKCISYLTIEKRGEIPQALEPTIGHHLFGCDICQDVCPFNKFAKESSVFAGDDHNPLLDMPIDVLSTIPDEEFRALTRDSAIRRAKPEGMRRNARLVVRNLARGDQRPAGSAGAAS